MRQNPIYPAEWFRESGDGSKYKVGSYVRKKQIWNPLGTELVFKIIEVRTYQDDEDTWYILWNFDNQKRIERSERSLDKYWEIVSYSENPIYPEEWAVPQKQKFHVGYFVEVLPRPDTNRPILGMITRVSTDGEKHYYDVELSSSDVIYHSVIQSRLRWTGKKSSRYRENPIYPQDWQYRDFQCGDYVQVELYPLERSKTKHYGVITCVTAAGRQKLYDVRLDNGVRINSIYPKYLHFTGERRPYRPPYNTNPIYPIEWEDPTRFKVGDIVVITKTAYRGVIGRIEEIGSGDLCLVRYAQKPHSVVWMLPSMMDLYYLGKNEKLGFEENPIYPAEWSNKKNYTIGDRVTVYGKPGVISGYANAIGFIWVKFDGNLANSFVDIDKVVPMKFTKDGHHGLR